MALFVTPHRKALWRAYLQPDRAARHGMRWFHRMGQRVWPHEWLSFFRERRVTDGPTLEQFWGTPQDHQEIPLHIPRRPRPPVVNDNGIRKIGDH